MAIDILDQEIEKLARQKLLELEKKFDSDVMYFYGVIYQAIDISFRDFIEKLRSEGKTQKRLTIILNTPGGSTETTEKLVLITRHHYKEIFFVVPEYAMSAGTVWCMSGDKIYMDYSSSLGPIDPQVVTGNKYVPALGYLDKVQELIKKSKEGELTQAEFIMLRELDLAELRSYEQARDLTISLLEEWLVKYKFKNWKLHRSDLKKKGLKVTINEKKEHAKTIAENLNDTNIWHSHGRAIGIDCLRKILRLEIEDYTDDKGMRELIRGYNEMLKGYIIRMGLNNFLHSRNSFF